MGYFMRKIFVKIFSKAFLAVLFFVSSCENVFENGELGHFWKLQRIEYPSGLIENKDSVFFGFARDLVEIDDYAAEFGTFGVVTDYRDSIRIDFTIYEDSEELDYALLLKRLSYCGIFMPDDVYKVSYPSKRKLELSTSAAILHFDRW